MSWTIEFVNRAAEAEVSALPKDMSARFRRVARMIREFGLTAVHPPHVKHLDGKLWEIRMKGRDGIARSIYVAASGERVVVLRTFVKKTEETPRREIDLALARMKEMGE
jgi:phage-related protein